MNFHDEAKLHPILWKVASGSALAPTAAESRYLNRLIAAGEASMTVYGPHNSGFTGKVRVYRLTPIGKLRSSLDGKVAA